MAAINPATDIPSTVDTVEKLLVYALYLADDLFSGKEVKTTSTDFLPRARKSIFTNGDGVTLTQMQAIIDISDTAFTAGTGKIWEYAQVVRDASIPADFLT
jgi:hypothetical protein